ncbi:alpha/beta hydrolase family protein [Paenibacillus sp. FSL H8-0537]|uniref:alpha/beta hydrolase n=1 Tax=Paenibacillus sp. FSL H8-0537 TaxID=2921399 RepID=UPI0031019BFB
MALFQCDFFSEKLGFSTGMSVILPQPSLADLSTRQAETDYKYPVLYLLHGLSDDHTAWTRYTCIERYASSKGIAVVMPGVHRSFYADMEQGGRYWSFVSEELPLVARSFFPLSARREDNFVAGLSMGGYGAFKLGLHHPERFAAAASLSGALDVASRLQHPDFSYTDEGEFGRLYGSMEKLEAGPSNLFNLLASAAALAPEQQPKFYQCCGTEDFLYEDNLRFKAAMEDYGLTLTYDEEPGMHEWGYWDRNIQRVLDWLPLSR